MTLTLIETVNLKGRKDGDRLFVIDADCKFVMLALVSQISLLKQSLKLLF